MKSFVKLLILLFIPFNLFAQNNADKPGSLKPGFDISALIHTDFIYDIKRMDPDWIGGFRPSKIPVNPGDPGWGTNGHLYFSIRQSTFKFNGYFPTKHKWGPVQLHFSFDLFGMGVHAGETAFRIRLAYGKWGPFLIGKDWSTFIDFSAFPNNWDWWGPSGMALLPDVMIRYTHNINKHNRLEVALELPGSEIDPGQLRQIDPSLLNLKTKEILPDLISRYTIHGNWGYVKTALLLRQLSYEIISEQMDVTTTHNKFGWAVNITSKIKMFNKHADLILQAVGGNGYAGYNNDGGVEITPDAHYHAEVPFQFGFVTAYDYYFNNKWQTSVVYSQTTQQNSDGQLDDAFHRSHYFVAQAIYNILPERFAVGLNYEYGMRINKNLASANDQRIIFSARYLINYSQ
jgi:hypothetical protein